MQLQQEATNPINGTAVKVKAKARVCLGSNLRNRFCWIHGFNDMNRGMEVKCTSHIV